MSNNSIFTAEEQLRLNRNQQVRDNLIAALTKEGIPTDTNSQYVLLAALKDSSDNDIKTAKIRIDNRDSENSQDMAALMSSVINQLSNKPAKRRTVPVEVTGEITHVVPGEIAQGTQHLTYDEFTRRPGRKTEVD